MSKRTETIHIEGGGYTSRKRAAVLVAAGRATINNRGQLEFPAQVPGRFEWHVGVSGGFTVMKGRGLTQYPER